MNLLPFVKNIFFLLLFLQMKIAYSQLFLSGEDPQNLKWQQINTQNFQIIFPKGFEYQAQYFSNVLEQAYEYGTKSLKTSPRKISVLIHNQSVISNGITAWAPRRIDVYTLPPQDNYAEFWLNQLAVHEFRHVVQIEKMNTGLTKILGLLLGQQAAVGVTGIYIPLWFIEGDAVVTETLLNQTGRGNLSSFEMPLKAQLLEKEIYTYDKAVHGSYKDFIPNQYELGYQIVAYGRYKYGINLWNQSLKNTARNPFFLNSFSSSIKKTTGLSKRELYKNTMNFLKNKWSQIHELIPSNHIEIITPKPKHYSNYINPIWKSDSVWITFKTSIDDVNQIVQVDKNGNEKILVTPGSSYLESLSVGGNLICWSEVEPDIRWSNRNFSVIKLFNIQTNVLVNLTHKSRYFSPQINKTGTKIATIEISPENKYSLVILDVQTGKKTNQFEFKDEAFLMHPTWSSDDSEIVMTVFTESKKNIRILNLKTGISKNILDISYAEISHPKFFKNRILFIADHSSIDNLYAYNLNTREISQITSVKFGIGNFDLNSTKNQIIFSNYSSDGFGLAIQSLDLNKEIPLSDIQLNRFSFINDLVLQEKGKVKVDKVNMKHYEIKKYPKTSKFFNFHSWSPFSIDLNTFSTQPGFMIMSQNQLSTAITILGYEYDMDEKLGKYYAHFEYRGWYPIINLNFEYRKERGLYLGNENHPEELNYTFREIESSIGISQPLNFSKNKFFSGITPFARFNFIHHKIDEQFPIKFREPNYQSIEYGFSVYHFLRYSLKDLYPKWGINGRIIYVTIPFTSLVKSNLFSAEANIYVPGFFKHHGFKFYGGMQLRNVGSYNPTNVLPFIRGLSNPGLHNLYQLSIDYQYPLAYPDWDVSSIIYLKRISMNLFYDYAYGTTPYYKNYYTSYGAEIQTQTHILSFLVPINISFRITYIPEFKDYTFNVYFNFDFSSLYYNKKYLFIKK